MDDAWHPQFVFAACQHGAENALKRELAVRMPALKPAFARPGFATFKLDAPCAAPEKFVLASTFARTWAFSLGAVEGPQLSELAARVWSLPDWRAAERQTSISAFHVWERDRQPPGDSGYEPGPTPLTAEINAAVRAAQPAASDEPSASRPPRTRWALDVAVIDPDHWFVGLHRPTTRVARWPGGVPAIELPDHAVSRAYLKMAEAMAWADMPMSRGERVVELGCAPGGASQALLDAGLDVLGLDPAKVDEAVLAHPRFTHVRVRAARAPRKLFRGVNWLAADMNVAPAYTLDAVEAVVERTETSIRGMLLTLKLADWELATHLPEYLERVRSWGYQDVRLRQLAFNRQEVCLAALRSRRQRRVLRSGTGRSRGRGQ